MSNMVQHYFIRWAVLSILFSLLASARPANAQNSFGGTSPSSLANFIGPSISTTGTITSGTWQGSIIGPTYGGTGTNNGTNTITIGGNVTMSGAFTFTGALTANTSVTFPTTGTLVNSAVTTLSSLSSIGTIGTGTWQGTKIAETYGGTNQSTYTKGDMLYASAANTLSKLGVGSTGNVLMVSGGVPTWGSVSVLSDSICTASFITGANNFRYITNTGSTRDTIQLPSSPVVGATVVIDGFPTHLQGYVIAQPALTEIYTGDGSHTTAGVSGNIVSYGASNNGGTNSITLHYAGDNAGTHIWIVEASQGIYTLN